MTTLQVTDEPLPQVVAARLRGLLAERKISHKEFGEMLGWNRGTYQRRLSGEIPLDLSELEHIERATGITVVFLLTGRDQTLPPPRPPTDPSGLPSRGSGQVLRLHKSADEQEARDTSELVTVDDDALAYVKLAGESLRFDSDDPNLKTDGSLIHDLPAAA